MCFCACFNWLEADLSLSLLVAHFQTDRHPIRVQNLSLTHLQSLGRILVALEARVSVHPFASSTNDFHYTSDLRALRR